MFYKLVALILLPILLVQGRQARKRALKLPEAIGKREGAIKDPTKPPLTILIIGDSAAAGVGVHHQDHAFLGQLVSNLKNDFNLSWALIAKTGAKTKDMTEILKKAKLATTFDIVITSLGVNDVTSLQKTKNWLNEQNNLHQYCFQKLGVKHIMVSGMPPMHKFPLLPQPLRWIMGSRAKEFDCLQASANSNYTNKSYEPLLFDMDQSAMAVDGFHPGPAIYFEWGLNLSKRIVYIAKSLPHESGAKI
nr:SGNH/GDSL hydrolase family protein [uncultured Glaciecola sp.]